MYFSSLTLKRVSHFLCLCLHLVTLPFSILQTHSLRRATGDFPVIQPLHSRIQLNHMSGVDKRSWNNASAAGPAKIKRQEVMSAYPPQPLKEWAGSGTMEIGLLMLLFMPEAGPPQTLCDLKFQTCVGHEDQKSNVMIISPVCLPHFVFIIELNIKDVSATGLKVQYVRVLADNIKYLTKIDQQKIKRTLLTLGSVFCSLCIALQIAC